MPVKQIQLPVVGDDVLYHMNGVVRPAKVVVGSDGSTTYAGLQVLTASDGTPTGVDKCSPTFFAYSPHGEKNGYWQWKEEITMNKKVVNVNEAGQIVEEQPVPVPPVETEPAPVVTESPSLPVGAGGALSPESNLGQIVKFEIETIKAAVSKIMGMTKNGRLTVTGSPADVEQFKIMVEVIGKAQEELRTVLFGQ